MTNVPKKPANLVYAVNDKPPFVDTFLLALQHVFVMSAFLICPVLIVRGVGGSPGQTQELISMSMAVMGLGTNIFLTSGPYLRVCQDASRIP